MGKSTGFLDYQRKETPERPPLERIGDFQEFHGSLSGAARKEQGGRCMNCGVPFCQSGMTLGGMVSGCPLHNLIPEWNEEIWRGNGKHALARLLKTNNFPEFTGRVCPALCEVACLCGVGDQPVTIKENELSIIEWAYQTGEMQPRIPSVRTERKVAVVGSGPSGLACADTLNHRGHHVTVFEKNDRIGGLLMYGIPNMKLDKKIVQRRVQLMQQEGVQFITGVDVGRDVLASALMTEYDAVVLCCGAEEPRDIYCEGRVDAQGVMFAVPYLSQTTASYLNSDFSDGKFVSAKNKHVVIVGGGDTGNDCVGTAIRQGCASVVQLELMPEPPLTRSQDNPWPQYPKVKKVDYGQAEALAVFGKDPRRYGSTIHRVIVNEVGHVEALEVVRVQKNKQGQFVPIAGSEEILPCDLLLIAAGFVGCKKYIADAFRVGLTTRNTVATQSGKYATDVYGVFSAGDMRRGQSLVVWAIAEGRACAAEVDNFLEGYTNL